MLKHTRIDYQAMTLPDTTRAAIIAPFLLMSNLFLQVRIRITLIPTPLFQPLGLIPCCFCCPGDCAVNMNPNSEDLAQIAIVSADTAKAFGVEPRVAMLSYSTLGSGEGPDVSMEEEIACKIIHLPD